MPQVDASALAKAVEQAAASDDALDYRTRLLIRDSLRALASHWTQSRYETWLRNSSYRREIEEACKPDVFDDDPNEIGFPSLMRNVVDATSPEQVTRFLRDLSKKIRRPTRLVIGGSIPLILGGQLTRSTQDIDVVDEVPAELRNEHQFLQELSDNYKLQLAHFQSHYLPSGWERRLRSLGVFGDLQVFLVDPSDIFVSKLFSARKKDKPDLIALASKLDRKTLEHRIREDAKPLRGEERLLKAAEDNWHVLFGEPLPD